MPSPAESAAPPAVDWAARRRGPVGLVAPGRYTAGGVTVSRRAVDGDLAVTLPAPSVQTPHFRVHQLPAGVVVQHDLHPGEIDNDLATHITAELFGRGPFRAAEDFEHCLVGLVVTSAEDPLEAWLRFYRNTLRRLRPGSPTIGPGAIADFADIYATAAALQSGSSALDVGCCFGFLAIRLAETWPFPSVTGLDRVAGTVRLLRDVLARLGPEVPPEPRIRPVCADATALPFPDASHDTAYAVHLLEHLEPAQTAMAVCAGSRCSRRWTAYAVSCEASGNGSAVASAQTGRIRGSGGTSGPSRASTSRRSRTVPATRSRPVTEGNGQVSASRIARNPKQQPTSRAELPDCSAAAVA